MKKWEMNNKFYDENDSFDKQVIVSFLKNIAEQAVFDFETEEMLLDAIDNSDVDSMLTEIRNDLQEEVEEPVHMPEIGNLLWGNSRGSYPMERGKWEQKFCELLDAAFLDYHGIVTLKNCKFQTERGGYENDVFLINPYYWGEDEEIEAEPNFVHKPTGFEIQWYKYPLRDSYMNRKITFDEFSKIIDDCISSIEAPEKTRAKWRYEPFMKVYYCDNCGYNKESAGEDFYRETKECPKCGAKMGFEPKEVNL